MIRLLAQTRTESDVAVTTRLDIDLDFSLSETGESEPLEGKITASGTEVQIFASNPERLFAGRSMKLQSIRGIADEIAALGLSVTVTGPAGVIASIGDVHSPIVQRVVTGSAHIKLGSAGALAPLLRVRSQQTTLPLPPSTPFPIVPTVSRRVRRHASTTHYVRGSGRPRLIFVVGSENWDGRPPREFNLLPGVTSIGSGTDCDLRLDGLDEAHAEIRHDGNDEYVFFARGDSEGNTRTDEGFGRKDGGQILRTGARIELGPWRMAFFREEFADHGRPFGGRLGGELSRQKPQQDRRNRP